MTNPKIRFLNQEKENYPDWVRKPLLNLVEKIKSGNAKKKNLGSGKFELYGATGKIGTSDDLSCAGQYILVARVGSIGEIQILDGEFSASDNVLIIKNNELSNLSFLYNYLQTLKWDNISSGTSQKVVSAGKLGNINIGICCIDEQNKIASFFSWLDKKLVLAERKLVALEKLKVGLMQKIFSRELKFKRDNGDDYPGWESLTLDKIVKFQNGINANKENFGSGTRMISVLEVLSENPIRYSDIRESVLVDDETKHRFGVSYGDILFQRSSETAEDAGMANVYVDQETDAVFGGFVIRGKKIAEYDPIFICELLRSQFARKQIVRMAQGAQHVNIGQESLSKVQIFFPIYEEQCKIGRFASLLNMKINVAKKEIGAIKTIKKAFMQQMFV